MDTRLIIPGDTLPKENGHSSSSPPASTSTSTSTSDNDKYPNHINHNNINTNIPSSSHASSIANNDLHNFQIIHQHSNNNNNNKNNDDPNKSNNDPSNDNEIKTTIGPGIYKSPQSQSIIPSSAGILNSKTNKSNSNRLIFIESNSKRYIPKVNDYVIGIITGIFGDIYKIQLQDFSSPVQLSMYSFPNATKKNRPNLKIGQAVYARISKSIPEIETELECIDPNTGKEGGFGLLDESGYIFDINLNFARELLFNKNSIFLEKLSTKCTFEIAIGINGKIWLKCGDGIKTNKDDDEIMDDDDDDDALIEDENGSLSSLSTNLKKNKNEEQIKKDNSSLVKDLKTTLAASRFLNICQKINLDQVNDELNAAFRNIE